MTELTLTTCQAINTDAISARLAEYLTAQLGRPLTYVADLHWDERYARLDQGTIAIGWICGAPYVLRADAGAAIELLAAPVMAAARYGDRPVYFSDVVVRADSPYRHFLELQGARWAYNELRSQSGYHITRYHLAQIGAPDHFFGAVVASGAHRRSLALVLDGAVDASAIDSTVLEWELAQRPELAAQIRVIATLGPSPIPPLVIQKSVPAPLAAAIRAQLLTLHEHEVGRALLATGRLARFAAVTDADYDPIRHMVETSRPVRWV